MRILLLTLLFCPLLLFSQLPAPLNNTYVHDYAHVLTADQVDGLNRTIKSIDTSHKIKFAIILINELPGNYTIEDYARDIGNKWQVGKGVIYVAAINQRKQRLEISSHLEGIIPDITALHITDRMKPHFRNKDYYGGLMGMIVEVDALLKADAALQGQPKVKVKRADSHDGAIIILIVVMMTTLIGILVYIFIREKRRTKEFHDELEKRKQNLNDDWYSQIKAETKKQSKPHTSESETIIPVIIPDPPQSYYTPPPQSYESPSSRNDDNNYGNYDSGSSSSSGDSYSGGGSTNDW